MMSDHFFARVITNSTDYTSKRDARTEYTLGIKSKILFKNNYAGRLAGHRVSASAFTFSDFHESGSCPFIL